MSLLSKKTKCYLIQKWIFPWAFHEVKIILMRWMSAAERPSGAMRQLSSTTTKIIGRDDFFGISFVMPAHSHVMRFLFMQPLHITKQVKLIIVFGCLFDY